MAGLTYARALPRASQRMFPMWQAAWGELSTALRAFWLLVVGASVVGAALMGLQVGSEDFLFSVTNWTYVIAPVGAGVLLALAARRRKGPGTAAWSLIGIGVASWGVGELIWVFYSWFLATEVPYPGLADVFYVAAYPVIFVGILMLPHMQVRKWERARLTLDALAGTMALSAIVWTFYLQDAIYLDAEAGFLENAINLGYPVGDLILLVALMILATRRSQLQFDGRLLVVSLGMLVTALSDMAYVFQVEADTYVEGGRLDAAWLIGYGLFAVAALMVAGPTVLREQADRPGRLWPMVAPYTAIAVLFALTLGELGGQATTLQVATAVVGIIVIARQGVAIKETRDVVEKQRNDLVASISHELRTPLTAMAGFTDILDEDPDLDRDDRVEMISIVNAQTKHLSRIVGDLVEVARDKLGTTKLTYSTISASELIDSAVGMLTNGSSDSEITTHIEDGLLVLGDVDRLRQVLVNFLTNAGRYGRGTVEVHAFAAGGETTIEVHDNGPGIPKKYEVTIWDRFERGPHTYLSAVQGSGLGLSIARQLVEAHDGHTGHRVSESLGGACFWLSVPAARSRSGSDAGDRAARSGSSPVG